MVGGGSVDQAVSAGFDGTNLMKGQGLSKRGTRVDPMEEGSSSDEDDAPETMPSNTKTAAMAAPAKTAQARIQSNARSSNGSREADSSDDDEDDEGDDDDEDGGGDGDGDTNSGKRKADDFLRRQELGMDPRFKATVVLPGDDVTETITRATRTLRLGPGLVQHAQDKVLATRAGMLRYRPPCSYWVESNGRRYSARVEDQVLGVVEDRTMESYKVNVFGR